MIFSKTALLSRRGGFAGGWISVCFLLVALGPGAAFAQPAPELRGMWVTRFEWPDKGGDAQLMKSKIQRIMQTLAQNHFNAVFFQVRGQADTLYPCPYETWSQLIGGKDPGFDPLAFAIEEAHRNGLQFHAYVNAFPCWQGEGTQPPDPKHIFNAHPDWLLRKRSGELVYAEYYYLSPGHPEVQAHLRRVVLDLIKRYDVDGVHFDRIRYPGTNAVEPVAEARFQGAGNPSRLAFDDWQRAQITLFLNDLYGQVLATRPKVVMSAAVWGIHNKQKIPGYERFSSGYHDYLQDSVTWIQRGTMDALVPMIYWDMGNAKPDYDDLYKYFMSNAAGRHIYGGLQTKYKDEQEPIRQIQFTRSVAGAGIVGFSYGGVDNGGRWPTYRQIFTEKAPVPAMPWKSDTSTGALLGVVTDAQGKPAVDAWVRVSGYNFVWLTSGDGLFSVLYLPPGAYSLEVEKAGAGAAKAADVKIEGGRVAQIALTLR